MISAPPAVANSRQRSIDGDRLDQRAGSLSTTLVRRDHQLRGFPPGDDRNDCVDFPNLTPG
jgi:hypothetical protein